MVHFHIDFIKIKSAICGKQAKKFIAKLFIAGIHTKFFCKKAGFVKSSITSIFAATAIIFTKNYYYGFH